VLLDVQQNRQYAELAGMTAASLLLLLQLAPAPYL
jgi:hypothetical protein